MWEGCQEHFRHEIPKETDSSFPHHTLAGAMRLNLTFRQRRFAWSQRAPLCACNRKCNLKPVLKHGRNRDKGRYCWFCHSKSKQGQVGCAVLLCCCAAVLLCYCTAVLLCYCAAVLLCCCAAVLLCYCAVLLY
jgi:hypothetical protein